MEKREAKTDMEKMFAILDNLPADTSFDEILREIAACRSIDRGLQDAKVGRVMSNEEAGRRIKSWYKK